MNVHRLGFLWKGQLGGFILTALVFFLAVGAVIYWKARGGHAGSLFSHKRVEPAEKIAPTSATASESTVTTYQNDIPVFPESKPAAPTAAGQDSARPVMRSQPSTMMAFPINDEPQLGSTYRAYGRFLRCKLLITVDSNHIKTPIVGLVLEDCYAVNGDLVIPAGTEVHGMAQLDSAGERIASQDDWVLVWVKDGQEVELSVKGIALDHEPDPDGKGWGITDGSAGLPGQLIQTDNLAQIKALVATFLSGAMQTLAQNAQQSAVTSSGTVLTEHNAGVSEILAGGLAPAGQLYAQQILQAVQKDGFYYRCAAGNDFYLYITQTLDPTKAKAGETLARGSTPASAAGSAIPALGGLLGK